MTQEETLELLVKTLQEANKTQTEKNEYLKEINSKQASQIDALELRIKELSAQIAYLNRQLFGRKSEKLQPYNPLQMDLFTDMLPIHQQRKWIQR